MTKAVIFLFIAIVVWLSYDLALNYRIVYASGTEHRYHHPDIVSRSGALPYANHPAGIIYAIWSGVGIVLIGLIGWLFLGQNWMCRLLLACFSLIIRGVIVINLFSKASVTSDDDG